MEHLDFIVCMILYPLSVSICKLIDSKNTVISDDIDGALSIVALGIYGSVAFIIY